MGTDCLSTSSEPSWFKNGREAIHHVHIQIKLILGSGRPEKSSPGAEVIIGDALI